MSKTVKDMLDSLVYSFPNNLVPRKGYVKYRDCDSVVVKSKDIFGVDLDNYYELWRKQMAAGKGVSASKAPHPCPLTEHPEHQLPNGYNGIWIDEFSEPTPSCVHEPINVGFNRCKMVCKKCDKVLEE